MQAIRINTIIDPAIIRFDELKDLKGKRAEIIILVEDNVQSATNELYKAAGALKQFSDLSKVAEEKTAYEKHVKEKYGNS
ncbi:hypothetical protein [Alkalitalea saponilacus]|uniref:Uncharacterized protein n=1 Tax=Alkalitalea saponilacus TaxID=889453 RepID=A0A1T5H0U6_9BACT|nr:hypothetical protein [Alkalitalea saponilacus]ASB50939.1 hypothetical protein CDL62_18195 [Alkalitalea saponilacus]SKC14323.1 hypothetical protein SAMN03080601_02023 [Alkalitalea saponilacus]